MTPLKNLVLIVAANYLRYVPVQNFGPAKQWPAQHYAELAKNLPEAKLATIIIGFC